MTLIFTLIIGYFSIIISDYMVHRNIMHAKWKIVKRTDWFFGMWLYPHYIQHLKVHHSHSIVARSDLIAGRPVPIELKSKKEKRYKNTFWPRLGIACSDHGMSIKDGVCLFSFLSLFLITPHAIVTIAGLVFLGAKYGAILWLFTLIPAYNHIHHRFYHMSSEAKRRTAPWYLRWYILSKEVELISNEHLEHHTNPKRSDDYYNLLPFGRYILRPLFGRH